MGVKCFMVEPVCDSITGEQLFRWDHDMKHGTPIMRRLDNGEISAAFQDMPGAIWYTYQQNWDDEKKLCRVQRVTGEPGVLGFYAIGPDRFGLTVVLPKNGHQWHVDGIAGNCTWKDKPHNCWSRTGDPPNISVGKGPPCSDGAGSIRTPGYHGHLNNGEFTDDIGDS